MEKSREEFEKWFSISPQYIYSSRKFAWEVWQAALNQLEASMEGKMGALMVERDYLLDRVKELEAKLNAPVDVEKVARVIDISYYRNKGFSDRRWELEVAKAAIAEVLKQQRSE